VTGKGASAPFFMGGDRLPPNSWAPPIPAKGRGPLGTRPLALLMCGAPLAYNSAMGTALHTVAETPQFLRDCAAVGVADDERKAIVDAVAADPRQGVEIRGSGGVRKIRVAGRGKGKSGGYRVMLAYIAPHAPVYLLALLSKGDRANFTAAEILGFKALTTAIGRYWRKGQE
jgi:hypothetical protein